MQPRSTLALPLTIRAWLAKCKLHFAGRLFFRWLTLVTFLLGLVAALALYVSDLGHLRAQVEIRSLLFPNMLSPNIILDHIRLYRAGEHEYSNRNREHLVHGNRLPSNLSSGRRHMRALSSDPIVQHSLTIPKRRLRSGVIGKPVRTIER